MVVIAEPPAPGLNLTGDDILDLSKHVVLRTRGKWQGASHLPLTPLLVRVRALHFDRVLSHNVAAVVGSGASRHRPKRDERSNTTRSAARHPTTDPGRPWPELQ